MEKRERDKRKDMKHAFGKWLITLALLLVFFVAIVTGCVPSNSVTAPSFPTTSPSVTLPPGTDLEFETVAIAISGYDEAVLKPQLQVITSKPDFSVKGVSLKSQTLIEAVDFSEFFVLIAFHGSTYPEVVSPEKGIEVMRIWQDKDIIYVLARFQISKTTVAPGIVTPYHVIKVSKESVVRFGEITFKLLDQLGQERATVTQYVPN